MYNPITCINVFQYFAISRLPPLPPFFFLEEVSKGDADSYWANLSLLGADWFLSIPSPSWWTAVWEPQNDDQLVKWQAKSVGKLACTLSLPCPFCLVWKVCPAQPMGVGEAEQRTEHLLLTEKSIFSFLGYEIEGCTRLETHWCSESYAKHELTKAIKLYQCLAKWC